MHLHKTAGIKSLMNNICVHFQSVLFCTPLRALVSERLQLFPATLLLRVQNLSTSQMDSGSPRSIKFTIFCSLRIVLFTHVLCHPDYKLKNSQIVNHKGPVWITQQRLSRRCCHRDACAAFFFSQRTKA